METLAFSYDNLGDQLQFNSPDTGISDYLTDDTGNRIQQTNIKNQITT